MPFTLKLVSKEEHRRIWDFRDEALTLLRLDLGSTPQPYAALAWYATRLPLNASWRWYRELATAMRGLDPIHSQAWDFRITVKTYFSLGTDILDLYREGSAAEGEREIRAHLHRRIRDWANIHLCSHDELMCLSVANNQPEPGEITFWMKRPMPTSALPLQTLAGCIEYTKPVAEKLVKIGNDSYERHFDPWPLSQEELMAALKEIEQQWFAPPVEAAA